MNTDHNPVLGFTTLIQSIRSNEYQNSIFSPNLHFFIHWVGPL